MDAIDDDARARSDARLDAEGREVQRGRITTYQRSL
jgi:hypothetical protein